MSTQRQIFKLISPIFVFITWAVLADPVYAMQCDDFATLDTYAVSPEQIICPIARVINIFIYSSVAVLIIMLLFGGLKLAMSMGDPKAFQAATGTWTWALIGFLVVVGVFIILRIVAAFFGWEFDFTTPFEYLYNEILRIRNELEITNV